MPTALCGADRVMWCRWRYVVPTALLCGADGVMLGYGGPDTQLSRVVKEYALNFENGQLESQ